MTYAEALTHVASTLAVSNMHAEEMYHQHGSRLKIPTDNNIAQNAEIAEGLRISLCYRAACSQLNVRHTARYTP